MSSFMDKAKDLAEDIGHKASDLADKAVDAIPDSVKEKASDFGDKAGELIDKAKEKLLHHDAPATDTPGAPDTPASAEPTPGAGAPPPA